MNCCPPLDKIIFYHLINLLWSWAKMPSHNSLYLEFLANILRCTSIFRDATWSHGQGLALCRIRMKLPRFCWNLSWAIFWQKTNASFHGWSKAPQRFFFKKNRKEQLESGTSEAEKIWLTSTSFGCILYFWNYLKLERVFCKIVKHMGVSKNRGTPKSSILIGFSITNHPFWGTPIFGNTHILIHIA